MASTKSTNRAIFATRLRFNDTSRERKCEFYASALRHNQPFAFVETFVIIEPKHLSRLGYNSKEGASLYFHFHSRIFFSFKNISTSFRRNINESIIKYFNFSRTERGFKLFFPKLRQVSHQIKEITISQDDIYIELILP